MRSQALGIVLAALALAGGPAQAQSAATLKEAVERAVLRNPEVKFKHHNVAAAAAEQDVARGGWRPTVDFEAGSGRESTLTPTISATRNYTHSLASIQLRQTLFDGFATQREVRRLGYSRQAAYYDLLATSDQIGLEAARAYIDVQRYRDLVILAKNNYASHADVHAKLGSRVAAGVGRRLNQGRPLPKCLLEFGGMTLLERHCRNLLDCGVDNLTVCVGHESEQIADALRSLPGPATLLHYNPLYTLGSSFSLWSVRATLAWQANAAERARIDELLLLMKLESEAHRAAGLVRRATDSGGAAAPSAARRGSRASPWSSDGSPSAPPSRERPCTGDCRGTERG
mgnify:CR=1 FL=1